MSTSETSNLAVLFDADNAQASAIGEILGEVARYGTATVKRAYGDWTTPNLNGWKDVLHIHAIQPMQQFSYTTGKNATDSALIIDAMDLLHGGKIDGVCLVSSDSDFTRLATRMREAGLAVYGFGEKKTPEPFVAACDKFIFTEILGESEKKTKPGKADRKQAPGVAYLGDFLHCSGGWLGQPWHGWEPRKQERSILRFPELWLQEAWRPGSRSGLSGS